MNNLVTPKTSINPRGQASYVHRGIRRVNVPTLPSVSRLSEYAQRPVSPTERAVRNSRYSPDVYESYQRHREAALAPNPHRKMALLLPGHNEELIIAATIHSAIAAGQKKRDIFVVDDASTDATRRIAVELLGEGNVLTVERSGKALAVKQAIQTFHVERDYQWLHVADADSIFSPDYFRIYRRKLNGNQYVVAIGFVQSLRGNWISTYRAFSYTYGQHFYRRIQAALGMVSVFPGPVTSFRTDILSKIDINGNNVTEDFDITLQVHRKNLGKILFIPKAINYTQDPQNYRDFCKQSMRWYRGFFQGIAEYRIGLRRQRIDIGIGFQLLQTAVLLIQVTILFPLVIILTHRWIAIPTAIALDFILTSCITLLSAIAIKRWTLLSILPYFYFLRISEVVMYFTAFVEIIILKRMRNGNRGWATEGRRYKLDSAALQDVAKTRTTSL